MPPIRPQSVAEWTHREIDTLLRSVARYTRFVQSAKVLIVFMVLFLTALLLFYLFIHNTETGIRVAFTSMTKGAAVTPTQMMNARFHGFDKDNQPFNVTAVTATQADWNTMNLDTLTGDISLKNGMWLSLSARNGVFHMKEKLLDLTGSIEMFDDQGYEMRTEHMHVDIGPKIATTRDPVAGQGPLGTLKAVGMVANGKTGVTDFGGPVHVTVYTDHGEKK